MSQSSNDLQICDNTHQIPRVWHCYLDQLADLLEGLNLTMEDLSESLSDYSEPESTDFPVALNQMLYQNYYDLANSVRLNPHILYQLWLYFRLNDDIALREYPETGSLSEEFSCSPEQMRGYACLYQGFFQKVFRTLLLTPGQEKQLFFVIMDGENSIHFMIRSKYGFLETYEIDSEIGIEMLCDYKAGRQLMYTVLSSS